MSRMVAFLLLALGGASLSAQVTPPAHLVYTCRVDPAEPSVFHFQLEITNPPSGWLNLRVPYFAPGAYREITVAPRSGALAWTQLKRFKAHTETGRKLPVVEAGERHWTVDATGAKKVVIQYTNEDPCKTLNNRSYLVENSGLVDGPRSWLYAEGLKSLPVHVRFELPEGWGVAGGLDPTFDPMVFTAKDYDRLVDCPTLVGLFHEWTFHVRGVPHRVVAATAGREPRFNEDEFLGMVRGIVEVYIDLFDDVPYEHYTFIYTGGGGGGLEHLTSTTISAGNPARLSARMVRSVTAHEFVHTWNVKRLRPFALGPFDYSGPARVKDLWICEGITSYYTPLGLWRAGQYDDAGFRSSMGRAIRSYVNDPYSWFESSEMSSWQVWDGGPLRYYNTGQVLGFAIDLEIREQTDNQKSLDDVMRVMYDRYGGYYRHQDPKPGYQSDDWPRVIREVTGADLEPFWNAHIRDSRPVDWDRYVGYAGYRLEQETRKLSGFHQVELETTDQGITLRAPEGSNLRSYGFRDGDILVGLNGRERTRASSFRRAFSRLDAESDFKATVQRAGKTVVVEGIVPARLEHEAMTLKAEGDGLLVVRVPCDLAWYEAGLRTGDKIMEVNGAAASSLSVLHAAAVAEGVQKLNIRVAREGQEAIAMAVTVRPFARPLIRSMQEVENPTKRQLAIRSGLHAGTAQGID